MDQRHATARPGEMHDTVETTALTGGAAPAGGASVGVEKVCCSCGKNVSGQKRFKDAEGRYWCYDCGVEDHIAKHPEDGIACAGCGGKFAPSKLHRFDDDEVYCEPCVTKKRLQKKRDEHRIAAAAAEAAEQERRRKIMLIVAAVVALVAIALAVWAMT
jgi:hypothetical protein